jgi:hypothetical protein
MLCRCPSYAATLMKSYFTRVIPLAFSQATLCSRAHSVYGWVTSLISLPLDDTYGTGTPFLSLSKTSSTVQQPGVTPGTEVLSQGGWLSAADIEASGHWTVVWSFLYHTKGVS